MIIDDMPGLPLDLDKHTVQGRRAATSIWDAFDAKSDLAVDTITDPRTPAFADAVIEGLVAALASSPGAMRKVMKGAAAAAEDLNVEQFQGLTEVIQNADDLKASEVRFALRNANSQLLIVHNGHSVQCQHVLGMALPFLSTKTNRPDQRGRFGIGLKTLRRIARELSIHSAPYHFAGDQLSLRTVAPEPALPGFYDPERDTLTVLDLKDGFDRDELKDWFAAWQDEGLLFLNSVSRFSWRETDGTVVGERVLDAGRWQEETLSNTAASIVSLKSRKVRALLGTWTVFRATILVPTGLHPAHKARSETTDISIAVPEADQSGSLYIGFKTRVPVDLSFSLDAPFDPSTAREALIENLWNAWLIQRCGDVIAEVALGRLMDSPIKAWPIVPLPEEHVGTEADRWLRTQFDAAFTTAREQIGSAGKVVIEGDPVEVARLSYEAEGLLDLLSISDVEMLAPESRALPPALRDGKDRWRRVLDSIGVSRVVDTASVLGGFRANLFTSKHVAWWIQADRLLIKRHTQEELFGAPIWLSDELTSLGCQRARDTLRPLVLAGDLSPFSLRWKLLDRLHPAYSEDDASELIIWLGTNAAFQAVASAKAELVAFAERFAATQLNIADDDLRDLRDRFDDLDESAANELGKVVGACLLVDGYVYRSGKKHEQKVTPTSAYLCKTLDSDFPNWPLAAGVAPGIQWIAARYDEQLKSSATRHSRKRADGKIPRGPRKFLILLGAETAPRLEAKTAVRGGRPSRLDELRRAVSDQVPTDYVSPDLQRVIDSFARASKKDLKIRSPALLKALARAWDRLYAAAKMVPSSHTKRVNLRDPVSADWLLALREAEWIAVGKGQLVAPHRAVIKTLETQARYETSDFAVSLSLEDFGGDLAKTLNLITSVRVSDLISSLRQYRDSEVHFDCIQVMQIYRSIAKLVPIHQTWNSKVGDLTVQVLRAEFSSGTGLILTEKGHWKRPGDLLQGDDIFHDRSRFVPKGPIYTSLWRVLQVPTPSLDDCLTFLKTLTAQPFSVDVTSALIDVYRYMEGIVPSMEARHRSRLKALPLWCGSRWATQRPIILVADPELRDQLAGVLPNKQFWEPPYDLRDSPRLVAALGVTLCDPKLTVKGDRLLAEQSADGVQQHFSKAVDHLSNELARNDPAVRQRLTITWDALRALPLFVYPGSVAVQASDEALGSSPISIELQAVITASPWELHACEDALPKREHGGRAIAALFPAASKRGIEAEWVVAWQESRDTMVAAIKLASDEEHADTMQDTADRINSSPKKKITVTQPGQKRSAERPRTLKSQVGSIIGATIKPGRPPRPPTGPSKSKLHPTAPSTTPTNTGARTAPIAYSTAELEQRGWEILSQALETSADQALVDFRNRHGVGADGVVNWKTFVEMKATGRSPQSSIEMSNAEFERAKERGNDFILALVSGLEDGYQDEVRLIIDPANRATVRPLNGIKLVALPEAPSIVIAFGDAADDVAPSAKV